MWHDKTQEHEFGCFYTMSIHKNHFKKQNYGTVCLRNIQIFKISLKYFNVTWPDYSGTQVWVFLYNVNTILRNKNMGKSLLKKHSKFQNFDEIFDGGMTRHKNSILNYCGLCRYVKAIKLKKFVIQSLFKNYLKFQNVNIQ